MQTKEKPITLIYKGAITQSTGEACSMLAHISLVADRYLLGLERHPINSGNSYSNIWCRRPLFDSLDPLNISTSCSQIVGVQVG